MKVFLYEYTCSAAIATLPAAASLCAEGWAMLAAVNQDMNLLPDVEPITLLHSHCEQKPAGVVVRFAGPGQEEVIFRELAADADYSLIIAPEFDDILFTRCRWVEEAGGKLLGPSSEAVRLTGDKLLLARHLRAYGIPTPPSRGDKIGILVPQ